MVGALVALGTAGQPDSGEGISDLEAAAGRGGRQDALPPGGTDPAVYDCVRGRTHSTLLAGPNQLEHLRRGSLPRILRIRPCTPTAPMTSPPASPTSSRSHIRPCSQLAQADT